MLAGLGCQSHTTGQANALLAWQATAAWLIAHGNKGKQGKEIWYMGMKWKKGGNKFVAELLLACFLAVSFAVPQTGVPIEATWVREVSEGEDPGKEPGSGETDDGRSGIMPCGDIEEEPMFYH